jgi:5-methylcytosine-specific restriction endonuclease McrA
VSLVLDLSLKPFGHSELPAPAVRRCTRCQSDKPLEDYRVQRVGRFGRMAQCRACKGAYDQRHNSTPERKAAQYAREQTAEFKARRRVYEQDRNATRERLDWLNDKAKRRRAMRKGADAETFTDAALFEHWDHAGYYACYWCDAPFTDTDPLARDHVVPLVNGGAHALYNLVPAHRSCNSSKGAKDPYDFARELHPWIH